MPVRNFGKIRTFLPQWLGNETMMMRIVFVVLLGSVFSILIVKYVEHGMDEGVPMATPANATEVL